MTTSCSIPGMTVPRSRFPDPEQDLSADQDSGQIILAGGCFWCVEAVIIAMNGVHSVESGYTGGSADSANYHAVCTGTTGHAEAIKVEYDPNQVSLGSLLKVFFSVAHDPTQRNRQGNDIGTQYRSAIFYQSAQQRQVAQAYIKQLGQAGVFHSAVVTELEPLETFYVAEADHQNFAARNPGQPYIMAVAAPKVQKLVDQYSDRLKPGVTSRSTDDHLNKA
ncbi:peptide-methionine (S)-S-oxide reductase MsrA [Marinobacter psychrophilus]|uniref:peptide-methionine (S)-S-oxide reductase MsrA n=1 Tax=Marinobacter psychrophilus TaxID=330734 RepID=UPI001B68C846|nr:peptide-methionine (S)-S-oxide reductase MsrA [Marinobacter psychrophilus]MBQ0764353.1 peptide-methionine (S)-S-oxide reductase MsrA [Marinobacter psychrophilus]MBQ0845133.1 peptide-methionine (S)-S-oxide reductase MsrA [Marinobacter psychrophilus]